MRNIIFSIIIAGLSSCNLQRTKPTFVLLSVKKEHEPESASTKKIIGYNYIVENYIDNKFCEKHVDSFAFKIAKDSINKYSSFVIDFYKASKFTNLKNLKEHPKDLDRYSNTEDYIYNYYWSQGTFLGRRKFKNGEIIEPIDRGIKLSDPPPVKN